MPKPASFPSCPTDRRRLALRSERPTVRAAALLAAAAFLAAGPVRAQAPAAAPRSALPAGEARDYDIPAGALEDALTRFGRDSGILLSFTAEPLSGLRSAGLRGRYTVQAGLDALLAGSGWRGLQQPNGSYVLGRSAAGVPVDGLPAAGAAEAAALPGVTVSATRELPTDLPAPYAGGQVARGARVGFMGNRDFLDTPFNVVSYTSQLIADQQATTLGDVLANDPSVRILTFGLSSAAGQGDYFSVRGFTNSSQDVAFDGVYGIAPATVFAAETIERVELLKGPNAMLNGTSPAATLGGTINLVPKRAESTPITRLTTSLSKDGQAGAHLDLGRRFGDDQAWGVRVNALYRDGDTAIGGQSTRLAAGTVGLDYRGARVRASLNAGYQSVDTRAPTGAAGFYPFLGGALMAPPDLRRQIAQDWEYSRQKSSYLLAKAEVDLHPNWSVYAALGSGRNRNDWLATDLGVLDRSGQSVAYTYYFPSYRNRTAAQVGARGNVVTGPLRHEISINASMLREDYGFSFGNEFGYGYGFYSFAQNIYAPVQVAAPDMSGYPRHTPRSSVLSLPSFAISDTVWMLDERVGLTVGARQQRIQVETYSQTTGARQSSGYDEKALTPSAAVVFKVTPSLALYANYIEGLSRGPTAPAGTTNEGQYLPPFKTKQIEAGLKHDFGPFAMTLAAFQIRRPSALRETNADGSNTLRVNGRQTNRGLELNLFGEPVRGLRLLGGVAYTQARLERTEGGQNDGRTAIGVPRWQMNLAGEFDIAPVPGLSASARLLATGPQYLDAANTRSIPGWTRWDAGLRYLTRAAGRPLTLRANVENLFNRRYWMTASEGWLNPGLPRTLTLSATFDL